MSQISIPIAITAVRDGDIEALKLMVDEELKQKDTKGRTAVHAACCLGYPAILRYLLNERGCSPHDTDDQGRTPAHYTCDRKWGDDTDSDPNGAMIHLCHHMVLTLPR